MPNAATRLVLSLAAAAALAFAATPALAQGEGDISTPAFANHVLAVYDSPERGANTIGLLPGGQRVAVDRCSGLWCDVHVGRHHGWVFLYSLSFGEGPNSRFVPRHFWW